MAPTDSPTNGVGVDAVPVRGEWRLDQSSPADIAQAPGLYGELVTGTSGDSVRLVVSGCSSAGFIYRRSGTEAMRTDTASTDGGCVGDVDTEYLACLGDLTEIAVLDSSEGNERLELTGPDCTLIHVPS